MRDAEVDDARTVLDIKTLPGLRSRCTTPARWISRNASTRPNASRRSSRPPSGPVSATTLPSVLPGTYSVAIHGCSASGSASTTGAVNAPLTRRAAATSCRNRTRNSSSCAYCASHDLDRHLASGGRLPQIDGSHAAAAELAEDRVSTDGSRRPGLSDTHRHIGATSRVPASRTCSATERHGLSPCGKRPVGDRATDARDRHHIAGRPRVTSRWPSHTGNKPSKGKQQLKGTRGRIPNSAADSASSAPAA